jgi:hypothetical protein
MPNDGVTRITCGHAPRAYPEAIQTVPTASNGSFNSYADMAPVR